MKRHRYLYVLLQVDDRFWQIARDARLISQTIIIMTSKRGATALRDDKTVGFGAKDIRFDQENMEKRIEVLKKDLSSRVHQPGWWKVIASIASSRNMQDVVKIMVNQWVQAVEKKAWLETSSICPLKLLAQQGYDQRWEPVTS